MSRFTDTTFPKEDSFTSMRSAAGSFWLRGFVWRRWRWFGVRVAIRMLPRNPTRRTLQPVLDTGRLTQAFAEPALGSREVRDEIY